MRKALLLPVILLFSIVGCKSQGTPENDLIAFNNLQEERLTKCHHAQIELLYFFETGDTVAIKNEVKRFNDTCKKFMLEIEKMKVKKEFVDLKNAFWGVFAEYYNLQDDYLKYSRGVRTPEGSRTEAEKKEFYEVAERINGRLFTEKRGLQAVQAEYNKKYNVILKGSERK